MLQGMGADAPERDDKAAWRELFQALESLEKMELVTIERANGRIDTLMLTSVGAELAREALKENR
jgi:DNA-binding MarR family transcriptional regulator